MKNRFNFSVSILTFLLASLVIVWLCQSHHIQFSPIKISVENFLLGLFSLYALGVICVGLWDKTNYKTAFSPKGLLIFSLTLMLILSIFHRQVGIIGTGIFVICSFLYVLLNRKVYAVNAVYLFILLYALMDLLGTIGSEKGFRFPEMTYTFYLIPLSFSCFQLDKITLFKIIKVLGRVMMLFIAVSVIYWFYNLMRLDVTFIDWITKKINVNNISGAQYVSDWCRYWHPSYINLVLLPTLMSVFYVFYKKNESVQISINEVIILMVGCITYQFISESRVGFVAIVLLLIVSALYFIYLKSWHFKAILIAVLVFGGISLFVLQNKVAGFVDDPTRKTDRMLAIDYIQTHWWWGDGYGTEYIVLTQQEAKLKNTLLLVNDAKTYVHNQLLGNMIQFGIAGAIVLLVFVVGLFWYAFKTRNFLLQMLMLLYFLFMFIEEPLYVQEGITRFMLFFGLFIHIAESEHHKKEYGLFDWFAKSQSS